MIDQLAECMTILYGSTKLKRLPDTMTAKYLRLYLLARSMNTDLKLLHKDGEMSTYQMAKYLKCDVRTVDGMINAAHDKGLLKHSIHKKRCYAWQFPDLLAEAEHHMALNQLRVMLPQAKIEFLQKRMQLSTEYVQDKIEKWQFSCISKDHEILFGMILHNR